MPSLQLTKLIIILSVQLFPAVAIGPQHAAATFSMVMLGWITHSLMRAGEAVIGTSASTMQSLVADLGNATAAVAESLSNSSTRLVHAVEMEASSWIGPIFSLFIGAVATVVLGGVHKCMSYLRVKKEETAVVVSVPFQEPKVQQTMVEKFHVPEIRWASRELALHVVANFTDSSTMVNQGVQLALTYAGENAGFHQWYIRSQRQTSMAFMLRLRADSLSRETMQASE